MHLCTPYLPSCLHGWQSEWIDMFFMHFRPYLCGQDKHNFISLPSFTHVLRKAHNHYIHTPKRATPLNYMSVSLRLNSYFLHSLTKGQFFRTSVSLNAIKEREMVDAWKILTVKTVLQNQRGNTCEIYILQLPKWKRLFWMNNLVQDYST